MPLRYSDAQEFEADQLRDLFLSVGWTVARHPEKLQQAMRNSDSVISVWDGDRLVGLINCLSDGVTTAYFHYLLIRQEYQKKGIGRALVRMMLDRYSHCLRRVLIADSAQVGFYEKCGFTAGVGTKPLFIDRRDETPQEVA